MKEHSSLTGIFPVVPTPLLDDESFDARGMEHLTNHYVDAGCHGLVVLGSGGELPCFTADEKISILKTAIDAARGRIPVIAGCGYVSLAETLEFLDATKTMDIDGYMVILPTYFQISFRDLYSFFRTVTEVSHKPVIYYHFPQITGHFLKTDQIKQLILLDGIAGIKESTICLPEIGRHIRSMVEKPVQVFTGTSLILHSVLAMGGAGAICPIAGIAPRLVLECYNAHISGDKKKAQKIEKDIRSFVPLVNTFGLPAGLQKLALGVISRKNRPSRTAGRTSRHAVIKETLKQLGHPITARVRSPLPQVTQEERDAVAHFIENTPLLVRERI